MSGKHFIAVLVDNEAAATAWWAELRQRYPIFARSLERNGGAVIEESLWDDLARLPGFEEGDDYARTALIDCGDWGMDYQNVTSGTHACFDKLA